MNRIQMLQIKKLLKELEYVESDFEYRNEVISEADSDFIKKVNEFLETHPNLKEVYDKKLNNYIKDNLFTNTDEVIEISEDKEWESVEKLPKVKNLYRKIVKATHPDKISKKSFNDLYLSATKYYNNNDKIGIYKICNELNIDYEIDEDDDIIIESKVQELRKRIEFIESTFAWQWINTKSDKDRNEILINYIKNRLL